MAIRPCRHLILFTQNQNKQTLIKMKRFTLALMAMLLMVACQEKAQGQTLIPLIGSNTGATFDTLKNANTVYFTSAANALSANRSGKYAIQFSAANVSGTSTYKVILQGTLDGTNWTNIHQVAGTNGIHCDTLQVTAGVPSSWIFRAHTGSVNTPTSSTMLLTNAGRFRRIRVAFVGTGTQVTRIPAVYIMNE